MRIKFIVFLIINVLCLNAQNKRIDSLYHVLSKTKTDSVKFYSYAELCRIYERIGNFKTEKIMCDSMLSVSKRTKQKKHLALTYRFYGDQAYSVSDHYNSIQYFYKAIKIYEEMGNKRGLCVCYLNMGNVYYIANDKSKALELFERSLAICNTDKTIEKEMSANIYNNLGIISDELGRTNLAKNYFLNALKLYELVKDTLSMPFSFTNLGTVYTKLHNKDTALYYMKKSLNIKLKHGSDLDKLDGYTDLGNVYFDFSKYNEAIVCYENAIKLIDTNNINKRHLETWKGISEAYKRLNNLPKAYQYLELCHRFSNISAQTSVKKTIGQLEEGFIASKKQYTDSILLATNNQIQGLKIQSQNEQLNTEKKQRYFLIFGLILLVIGVVVVYNRYKVTRNQKVIIEKQHNVLEEKNNEILHQKEVIEEKQKEVLDSINYAQRIQHAVLTNDKVWNKISEEHFILFQPKDIVSGDFYWAYNTPNNRSIWAVADCTGHGVPGAFMSMLGNSLLNQIVVEGKIFKANEILNKLREKIIEALMQKGVSRNDGMDISLCVWNKINNTLEFSGANNSIVIARQGSLIELKADKMPIGNHHSDLTPFTCQELQLQKDDVIYMYTDGYADQFGGPKGKKFRYKELDSILIHNASLPMEDQREFLFKTFVNWKGNLVQTDDICIIGIKVYK